MLNFSEIRIFFSKKKCPSKNQWGQFLKILSKKEKNIFFLFLAAFLISFIFIIFSLYFKNTEIQPAPGGIYVEGAIGQPRFINPIYASASDVDRDLTELLFSGLMKYDAVGRIIPDITQSYEIKEGGRVYEFDLKENVFWHDGVQFTANDVIFTIKTIQNPDHKSPLRANWVGIEVEKINDFRVRFRLKNPYLAFLETVTVKILPEHIWQDIDPKNFHLAIYNLRPVGSGPYKLKSLDQEKLGKIISLELLRNQSYFGKTPYISQISFHFFDNEEDLIKSYQQGDIKGFSLASFPNFAEFTNSAELYSFSLPRYFAVFFNPEKSKVLSQKEVRQALNYGTNKREIVEKILAGQAKVVESPILPEFFGFELPSKTYEFNAERAKEILENIGFGLKEDGKRIKIVQKEPAFQFKSNLKLGSRGQEVEELQKCLARFPEIYPEGEITGYFGEKIKEAVVRFQEKYSKEILEPWGQKQGTGLAQETTRAKLNEVCLAPPEETFPLGFSLATVNQPVLVEVAELLKKQWQEIGVEVKIEIFDISQITQDIIKPRNYEALLFGEVLGGIPDPFPFWHSVQKKDPGLNLAIYESKKADKLLEEARQSLDSESQKKLLEEFQDVIIEDAPVVFLYSPDYLYLISREIKGVTANMIGDPSKRFGKVENWYIKTKRVLK